MAITNDLLQKLVTNQNDLLAALLESETEEPVVTEEVIEVPVIQQLTNILRSDLAYTPSEVKLSKIQVDGLTDLIVATLDRIRDEANALYDAHISSEDARNYAYAIESVSELLEHTITGTINKNRIIESLKPTADILNTLLINANIEAVNAAFNDESNGYTTIALQ